MTYHKPISGSFPLCPLMFSWLQNMRIKVFVAIATNIKPLLLRCYWMKSIQSFDKK